MRVWAGLRSSVGGYRGVVVSKMAGVCVAIETWSGGAVRGGLAPFVHLLLARGRRRGVDLRLYERVPRPVGMGARGAESEVALGGGEGRIE